MNEKFTINREDGHIIAEWHINPSVDLLKKKTPIAIILHGLAGYKEETMLQTVKDCFVHHHIPVLMYDARHSLGESGGRLENACFSEFIKDLRTVIQWLDNNGYDENPLVLAGHSLGAGAALHMATRIPNRINGIISMSAVYNGQLLKDSYMQNKPEFMQEWKKTGLIYREHPIYPQRNGLISIKHLDDACQYAVENEVHKIQCPVLIICGNHDVSSTININEILYHSFQSNAEMVVIQNCGHTYSKEQNRIDLTNGITNWLEKHF